MSADLLLRAMLEKHRLLDEKITSGRERFPSDWNGSHPFAERFLGPDFLEKTTWEQSRSEYIYFEDLPSIIDSIRSLHCRVEGLELDRANIVAGPGSSSLLAALSLWLLKRNYGEVYYAPPLYYSFHYFLRLLGIQTRPISGRHLFDRDEPLQLPPDRTVLLVCDPVWYAGRRIPRDHIQAIVEWQRTTQSLVIVDGSFQFMQWDGTRREHSADLDPRLTFRLIAPTKSLAIPCFRFAYLLLPQQDHEEFSFLYENLVGSASIADYHFAARALTLLQSDGSNRLLTDFLRSKYETLIDTGTITTVIEPDAGYFVFAELHRELPGSVFMDQEFFELRGYPNYVRINLLKAETL